MNSRSFHIFSNVLLLGILLLFLLKGVCEGRLGHLTLEIFPENFFENEGIWEAIGTFLVPSCWLCSIVEENLQESYIYICGFILANLLLLLTLVFRTSKWNRSAGNLLKFHLCWCLVLLLDLLVIVRGPAAWFKIGPYSHRIRKFDDYDCLFLECSGVPSMRARVLQIDPLVLDGFSQTKAKSMTAIIREQQRPYTNSTLAVPIFHGGRRFESFQFGDEVEINFRYGMGNGMGDGGVCRVGKAEVLKSAGTWIQYGRSDASRWGWRGWRFLNVGRDGRIYYEDGKGTLIDWLELSREDSLHLREISRRARGQNIHSSNGYYTSAPELYVVDDSFRDLGVGPGREELVWALEALIEKLFEQTAPMISWTTKSPLLKWPFPDIDPEDPRISAPGICKGGDSDFLLTAVPAEFCSFGTDARYPKLLRHRDRVYEVLPRRCMHESNRPDCNLKHVSFWRILEPEPGKESVGGFLWPERAGFHLLDSEWMSESKTERAISLAQARILEQLLPWGQSQHNIIDEDFYFEGVQISFRRKAQS